MPKPVAWTVHGGVDYPPMYNKLFTSILQSSIWSEDSDTCKVWITLLALADKEGFVFGSPAGISRIAGIALDKTKEAIAKFLAPDPNSSDLERAPEREGRRIEIVDGGWRFLNFAHYTKIASAEDRRAQYRRSKQKSRQRESTTVNESPPSEVDTNTETDTNPSTSPREKEVLEPGAVWPSKRKPESRDELAARLKRERGSK